MRLKMSNSRTLIESNLGPQDPPAGPAARIQASRAHRLYVSW